jgi:hypothetical protein
MEGQPYLESGPVTPRLAQSPWPWLWKCGRGPFRGESREPGLDLAVAGLHLGLAYVERLQMLAEGEDVFGAVVACKGRSNIGLARSTPHARCFARTAGSVTPLTMSRRIRSPVVPVMSAMTTCSCRFICTTV